jgi:hypothetical protein
MDDIKREGLLDCLLPAFLQGGFTLCCSCDL